MHNWYKEKKPSVLIHYFYQNVPWESCFTDKLSFQLSICPCTKKVIVHIECSMWIREFPKIRCVVNDKPMAIVLHINTNNFKGAVINKLMTQ